MGFGARHLPALLGLAALVVFALWYWNPDYRYDEYLVAVARARLSWPELFEVIGTTDPGPAVLYVLMKPWSTISTEPWWTRIPSLLAMTVAVIGLVALVQRAVDTRTAAFAGLLAIILPGMSRWAQDNRMYAAATAFLVIAAYAWWRSVHGGSRAWSAAYGLAVLAMGLFHLYTAVLVAVFLLASAWVTPPRRPVVLRTIVPALLAGLCLAPLAVLNALHPTGSPANPPATLYTLGVLAASLIGIPLTLAMVPLGLLGAFMGWRVPSQRAIVVLGVTWVAVPLAAFVLARIALDMPTLAARYSVFLLPGACIVAALGLASLHVRWPLRTLGLTILLVVIAIPEGIIVRLPESHRQELHVLRHLLGDPAVAGHPVIGLTRRSEVWIDAALYPARGRTRWATSPGDVVVVVHASRHDVSTTPNRYLDAGGPWQTIITCRPDDKIVLDVLATPEGRARLGDPAALAQDLETRLPEASCVALPEDP